MRKLTLIAGMVALALPGLAAAQPSCHEQKNDDRVVGTVVGAGVGAVIGGAIGHGPGAVAGAVGGGVIGNAAGGSQVHCDRTGFYDTDGVWHQADGYYDTGGNWVSNPASGYYDTDGHWIATAPMGAGADVAFTGDRGDIDGREARLEHRIHTGLDNGALTREEAHQDFDDLNAIRGREAHLRSDHDGLTDGDRSDLNARLDDLSASLHGD
jgi:hypothetical protein